MTTCRALLLSLPCAAPASASQTSHISALGTRSGKQVDMLLWNYNDNNDRANRAVSADPSAITLQLTGFTSKQVSMQRYLVDPTHGNAYDTWQKQSSPPQLTKAQKAALIQAGRLDTVFASRLLPAHDGRASFPLPLARQWDWITETTRQ